MKQAQTDGKRNQRAEQHRALLARLRRRHTLSERHCREIVEQWRLPQPALGELDPLELVREALERRESLVEELALLAEKSRHDAVRLGACHGGTGRSQA